MYSGIARKPPPLGQPLTVIKIIFRKIKKIYFGTQKVTGAQHTLGGAAPRFAMA